MVGSRRLALFVSLSLQGGARFTRPCSTVGTWAEKGSLRDSPGARIGLDMFRKRWVSFLGILLRDLSTAVPVSEGRVAGEHKV